jgi:hypothetical protein
MKEGEKTVDNEYNEEFIEEELSEEPEYAYQNIVGERRNTRLFSILSLVLSAISVLCCLIPVAGILFGISAICFGIYSRLRLGYFDGLSLGGIITSIFGVVFSVAMIFILQIIG